MTEEKKKTKNDLDRLNAFFNFDKKFDRTAKLSAPDVEMSDIKYMTDISEALMAQRTPASSTIIYLMCFLVIVTFIWAYIAVVDEVTQAEARVIPSGKEQVINSLEGGLLSELLVAEGDLVQKNQPLAKLDSTRFASQYKETVARKIALKAAKARASAEAFGTKLKFPNDVMENNDAVENETRAYEAKKKTLEESIQSTETSLKMIQEELEISEKLSKQGLYSIVELSRLQRQANDMKQRVKDSINRYKENANQEIVKINNELSTLEHQLSARLDTYKRTTLKSPVKGIVKNVKITTLGSVVPGSAPIMEVVPVDVKLLVEARLDPKDISFVEIGLPVALKLNAYDSNKYGELIGIVTLIGPDTIRDDGSAQAQAGGYYRILIEAEIDKENYRQKEMLIVPGMLGVAQIKTGKKSVLKYVTKPLQKAKDAFRER